MANTEREAALIEALANLCNSIAPNGLTTDAELDRIADEYGGHVADCYQQAHELLTA